MAENEKRKKESWKLSNIKWNYEYIHVWQSLLLQTAYKPTALSQIRTTVSSAKKPLKAY